MKILVGEILFKRNISYAKLAMMTGIPKSTIADICNGRSMPRINTLEIIAKVLKLRITDLFDSEYK